MLSPIKYSVILLALAVICSCNEEKPVAPQTINIKPANTNGEEKRRYYSLDKSPMDMIYFPEDFPVLKMSGKIDGTPIARVIYSRPAKDGRNVFGNVVKYGTYWRLGANEGTELEFFTDVEIYGRKVKKGRYILYCIPYERKWTLKLNNDLYSWGLRIHSSRDVYSFDVPTQKTDIVYDLLTMKFEAAENGGKLFMAWDSVTAVLPFTY